MFFPSKRKKLIIKSIVSIKYSCSCVFFYKAVDVYNVHNLWKVYLRQQPDSMRSVYYTPLIVILPIIEISVDYNCMPRRLFLLFFLSFFLYIAWLTETPVLVHCSPSLSQTCVSSISFYILIFFLYFWK